MASFSGSARSRPFPITRGSRGGAMKNESTNSERREFLKTATGAAGAAMAAGFPGIISGQTLTNAIKVGLVGCGGRGSGAASEALAADDYAELNVVADIDQ